MPASTTTVPARAIGLIFTAYLLFAALDTTVKWLVLQGYHPLFLAWIRFFGHLLLAIIWLAPWKNKHLYSLVRWKLQMLRASFLCGATFFNFIALKFLQLSTTITLLLASPFIVALLAGPLLKEWVGPRRWIAIGIGFIGVLVVIRPGTSMFQWPMIYSLISTVFLSLYFISTRYLHGESSDSLLIFSAAFATIFLLPVLFVFGQWPQSTLHWVLLTALGLLGAIGHWCFIEAVKLADASVLAPSVYSQLIWMIIFGWLIFSEKPDNWTLAGASIIVFSGLYLWARERKTTN